MNEGWKRAIGFTLIILLAGTTIGFAAVPQDTLRTTGTGVTTQVLDYLNSTNYYRGTTNFTGYILNANPAGAATFGTVDTGQGANELYDMDQNVLTTSDVNFSSVEADDYWLNGLTNLTAWVEAQIAAMGGGGGLNLYPWDYFIFTTGWNHFYVYNATGGLVVNDDTCANAYAYVFNTQDDAEYVLLGPGYHELFSINITAEASTGSGIVISGFGREGYGTAYKTQLKLNGNPGIYAVGDDFAGGSAVTLVGVTLRAMQIRGDSTKCLVRYTGRLESFIHENVHFLYGNPIIHYNNTYGSSKGGVSRDCIYQIAGATTIFQCDDISDWGFYNDLSIGDGKTNGGTGFNFTDGTTGYCERVELFDCQFNNIGTAVWAKVDTGSGEFDGFRTYGGLFEACDVALQIIDVSGRADVGMYGTKMINTVNTELNISDIGGHRIDLFIDALVTGDLTPEVYFSGTNIHLHHKGIHFWDTESYVEVEASDGDFVSHGLDVIPDYAWANVFESDAHYSVHISDMNSTMAKVNLWDLDAAGAENVDKTIQIWFEYGDP